MEGMNEIAETRKDDALTKAFLKPRTNEDLLFDVTSEYCQLSARLTKLNSAIEADYKCVRQEQKDLWKKQAEYMAGYKNILADRIKDILEHN